MKKSIFLLAAGALALTACTSEEILESGNQGNVIGFENVVSKQTRADVVDLDYGTLKHFNVFGYYTAPNDTVTAIGVFDDQDVSNETGEWSYGEHRYWVPGATYYFYAYSCDNSPLSESFGKFSIDLRGKTPEERAFKIKDYVCDETHQHDLIFAAPASIEAQPKGSNSPVSLKFNHLLAKVNATFTSKFPHIYNVEISDVKIEGIRNSGDYSAAKKTWTTKVDGDNPKVNLWINSEEKDKCLTVSDTSSATTNSAYVLPYTYTEGDANATNVTIKFDIAVRDTESNVVILSRHMSGTWIPTWETGHKYTYNIVIDGSTAQLDVIAFEVTEDENGVSNWEKGTGEKITLSAN